MLSIPCTLGSECGIYDPPSPVYFPETIVPLPSHKISCFLEDQAICHTISYHSSSQLCNDTVVTTLFTESIAGILLKIFLDFLLSLLISITIHLIPGLLSSLASLSEKILTPLQKPPIFPAKYSQHICSMVSLRLSTHQQVFLPF